MKFARMLRATAFEGMPQMQTLFSAYKALKKKIKKLPRKDQVDQLEPSNTLTEEEAEFVQALADTLNQLNDVYIEQEENSVIRVERLESELATATTLEQLNELHKQFVDFHGEVLLLVHWSILAYTATVKILKKHHKRTGLLLRAPELGNLLSQPFCSTELMTSIARRVEEDIQQLSERMGGTTRHRSEPSFQQVLLSPLTQMGDPQSTPTAPWTAAAITAAEAAAASSHNTAARATALLSAVGQPVAAQTSKLAGHELPDRVVDMQLLMQLAADTETGTSHSDDDSAEQDTCASKQPGGQQPDPQRLADSVVQEVPLASKRRKVAHPQQSSDVQEGDVHEVDADGIECVGAGAGSAPPAAAALPQPDCTAGAAAISSRCAVVHGEQQPLQLHATMLLGHMCPAAEDNKCSATGPTLPLDQQSTRLPGEPAVSASSPPADVMQQQQPAAAAKTAESDSGDAAEGLCGREASIMRQTQVALSTWRHLQSTASTPSTVMQGTAQSKLVVETAPTASSAVQ